MARHTNRGAIERFFQGREVSNHNRTLVSNGELLISEGRAIARRLKEGRAYLVISSGWGVSRAERMHSRALHLALADHPDYESLQVSSSIELTKDWREVLSGVTERKMLRVRSLSVSSLGRLLHKKQIVESQKKEQTIRALAPFEALLPLEGGSSVSNQ